MPLPYTGNATGEDQYIYIWEAWKLKTTLRFEIFLV